MNPNTQHQLWSQWVFTVYEGGRHVPFELVKENLVKWIQMGFGSVGQLHLEEHILVKNLDLKQVYYVATLNVEGAPAHDPGFVTSVRRQFLQRFVQQGFGPLATGTVTARVLAGDMQDGKPPAQLIVIPTIRW